MNEPCTQFQERLDSELGHIRDMIKSFKELIEQRFEQDAIAKDLALRDITRRLSEMNEFRSQLNEERNKYILREIYDREHQIMVGEIKTTQDRITIEHSETQQQRSGLLQRPVFDAFVKDFYAWRDTVNLSLTKLVTIELAERDANAQDERLSNLEEKASNFQGRLWMAGAAMSAVVVLLDLAIKFWK